VSIQKWSLLVQNKAAPLWAKRCHFWMGTNYAIGPANASVIAQALEGIGDALSIR
jgi:hypothetical protein